MRKYAAATIIGIDDPLADSKLIFPKTSHRHVFAYVPQDGFIYVRSRMISSRCNDNYDEFPAEEIRKGWRSFIGKPVFVNHKNDNINEARGVIKDAALHDDVNPDGSQDLWVEGLMEVDARAYPKLAERVLAGDIDKTSMGCDVDFSVCSACGNKAYTPLDYCAHIPKQKGLKLTRRNAATGAQEDVLIREICYGLRFFENSLLVEDPADPTAFFTGVDDRGVGGGYRGTLPKAASKVAADNPKPQPGDMVRLNDPLHLDHGAEARLRDAGPNGATVNQLGVGIKRWPYDKLEKTSASKTAETIYGDPDHDDMVEDGPYTKLVKKRPGWIADYSGNSAVLRAGGIRYNVSPQGGSRDTDSKIHRVTVNHIDGQRYDIGRSYASPKGAMDAAERHADKHRAGWRDDADEPMQQYYHGEPTRRWQDRPFTASHIDRYVDDPGVEWRTVLDLGAPHIYDAASEQDAVEDFLLTRQGYDVSVGVHLQRRVNGEWQNVDDPPGVLELPEAVWDKAASKTSLMVDPEYGLQRCGTCVHWKLRNLSSMGPEWGRTGQCMADDNPGREHRTAEFSPCRVFDSTGTPMWSEASAPPKLGYGERTAPPEIDTLRDEKCPVCGETDGFSGERCMICNYVKPPDPFMDPDLDIAQQVDLRQDQNENQGVDNKADKPAPQAPGVPEPQPGEAGELVCDMCGAGFDGSKPSADLKPADDKSRVPGPRQDPSQPIDTMDGRVEVEVHDGQPSPNQPTAEELGDTNTLPKPKVDPEEADPNSQTQPQPGDTCPNCGEGTLQPKAPQAPQDAPPNKDEAGPVDDAQGEKSPPFVKDEGESNAENKDKPAPENQGDNPTDPVEDEETPLKDRKKQKESTVRQALRMIQELQIRQQAHTRQIGTIASAAGMTPQIQAIEAQGTEHIARLRRQGDVENPAQPVPSPGSEAPVATTAETIAPISPMSPAGGSLGNEVTTPGSTTETDVAPDAQTNLLDPVAACFRTMAARGFDTSTMTSTGATASFIQAQDFSGSTVQERHGYGEFVGNWIGNPRIAKNEQGNTPAPVDFQTWKRHTATQRTADAILDEPLDLNEIDVTKPVAGTEGPRPLNEVRIETEVRQTDSVDGTNDINSAQGVPGVNDTPPQKVSSLPQPPTPEERIYAAQRLATLRISAGMEQGDPLTLGQRISSSDLPNEAIVTEIDTLQRVAKTAAMNPAYNPPEGEGQQVAPRNIVPRTAASALPQGVDRMTPSMASGVTVPMPSMANAPSADEFLFE